jgi:hypothetical protein
MDLSFLSQADHVSLKLELAKRAFEEAKINLEFAKEAYDSLLTQADEQGIPKAKLKKLTEDRVQALLESGILASLGQGEGVKAAMEPKRERAPKNARQSAKKSEAVGAEEERGEGEISPEKLSGEESQPAMSN